MECRTVRKIWLAAALVLALVLGCGLAQADVVVEVDTHAELLQAIADAKAAGEQAIADGKEAPLYVIRLTTETLVLDQLIVEPLGGTLNYYHFLVLEYPARVSIESACQSGTTITVDWDEYSSLIAAGKGFGAPILINGSYYQENGSYYTTVDPLLRLRNLTFDFSGSSKMKSHELMINGMGGTLDFENVTFRNLERNGGYDRQLLIVSGMEIKMSNCIFEDNALLSRTGKSTAFAASASNVRVENCTFRDNTGNYGAAVQIDGVGFLGHKNPEALFINCAFTGNTSWSSPAFRS